MIYVESSVLLEIYLGQQRAARSVEILAENGPKVSSWLLAIEVPVALRRLLGGSAAGRPYLGPALARLRADLAGLSLIDDLPAVAERIGEDSRFARCRALDAIHVASASLLQEMSGQSVRLATFDARVAELAKSLGIEATS